MSVSKCPQIPWRLSRFDEGLVESLSRTLGVSRVTARILAARGLTDFEEAHRFLEPDLGRDWHDPFVIPGMREATERVARAIRAAERILIFGDFDLDGISAAAIATHGLRALGGRVEALVPHRFDEGYGLSGPAIDRALERSPDLVVTVDCGVSGGVGVVELLRRGVDVVVTDHHEPDADIPEGVPVANPKLEPSCPSRDLAGAGVALKLVHAVGRELGRPDDWRELTDLAALGTLADIVALRGENRGLVEAGVERIRTSPRVPLAALCAVAAVSPAVLGSDTVAFGLAPRLNAAGRMASPQVALDLLLTDDPVRAEEAAHALDEYNRLRQVAEADLLAAASALAERVYAGERALILAGEGWHDGVKGIVASRLAKTYGVPTILFSLSGGVARGSGRSVGSVDLFDAVRCCDEVLERFGGHKAAVGLTLAEADLERFRAGILERLDALPAEAFEVALELDAEVTLEELGVELGEELSLLEPFGHHNPRPLLMARRVFMNGRERVGKGSDHLRFLAFDGVASLQAIAFRCRDIDRIAAVDDPVDLAFELQVDEWRGRTRAQLVVRDIRVHEGPGERTEGAASLVEDLFAHADELLARETYAGIEDAPSFHTKLAGVTFEGRQEALARLTPGAKLRLVRQPDNPHDENACALFDPHGGQVGFLNRRLASVLARAIDAGVEYDVEVTEVTGGDEGRARGVNVLVTRRDAVEVEDVSAMRAAARAQLSALPADELEARLIRSFLGERGLHPAQIEALSSLAQGVSTLVVMATGRGKSLIFHLHAARLALRDGAASVFVYPLRALVADQAFHLREAFSEVGLAVAVVTGETSQTERDEAFARIADGSLDVVLTTPEFVHYHTRRFASTGRIRFVVVDEAHHVGMARAGHRPAYARLGESLEALPGAVVLAVTATAPDDVALQIRATLGVEAVVLDPTVRGNLHVEDLRNGADRDDYVVALASRAEKMVIYVNSREASVRIARMLRKRVPDLAWRTAFYNGGLSRSVRHAVERAFRSGDVRVIVATSAFGEGVNIPDIRHVVLYHLPFNEVEFNQMAGRAGRDGALARVHLLFGDKDVRINERILSSLAPDREDLAALYRALADLASRQGEGFEVTNAELAARCGAIRRGCALDERGVSHGLGIFRDLGLVSGEGHSAYRRLTVVADAPRVELTKSVRYVEGLEEIEEFGEFRKWVLSAPPEELLARFNRPILPTRP